MVSQAHERYVYTIRPAAMDIFHVDKKGVVGRGGRLNTAKQTYALKWFTCVVVPTTHRKRIYLLRNVDGRL